jgi:hypothetical protein
MERHVLPVLWVNNPQALDEMQIICTEIVADTFALLLPLMLVKQHDALHGTDNVWGTGRTPTPKGGTFEDGQPPGNL